MNLRTHLQQSERGRAADIARVVGVHQVMISQWASGLKPIPIERCVAVEAATDRKVRRWDLRPDDWHRIWPELVGTEGAPDVPADQQQEVRDAA